MLPWSVNQKKSLSVGEICSDWENLQLERAQFHTTLWMETGGWLEMYTGYIDWKWNWNLSRGLLITFWPTSHPEKRSTSGTSGTPSLPVCLPELTKEYFQLSVSLAGNNCALAAKVWLRKTKAKSNTSWCSPGVQLSVEENKKGNWRPHRRARTGEGQMLQ